jgi:hypothetical protein
MAGKGKNYNAGRSAAKEAKRCCTQQGGAYPEGGVFTSGAKAAGKKVSGSFMKQHESPEVSGKKGNKSSY